MTIPEIIVLSLVGAAFVAGIIYVFINWKKPVFPEGDRIVYESSEGYKVHLILDGPTFLRLPTTLAEACAHAAFALDIAWGSQERKGSIQEVVVVFKSEDRFTYYGMPAPRVQAYLTTCSYKLGKGYIPMAVIRDRHIGKIFNNGEPLIHELCHELLGEHVISRGEGHQQGHVWAVLGEDTIQYRAHDIFKKLNTA
jgi:hypothetical protein